MPVRVATGFAKRWSWNFISVPIPTLDVLVCPDKIGGAGKQCYGFETKHLLMLVVEGRPMLQQVVTVFRDQLQSACDAAMPMQCHAMAR
jgi:hypothetical protein